MVARRFWTVSDSSAIALDPSQQIGIAGGRHGRSNRQENQPQSSH
jgi:hypothetical protein